MEKTGKIHLGASSVDADMLASKANRSTLRRLGDPQGTMHMKRRFAGTPWGRKSQTENGNPRTHRNGSFADEGAQEQCVVHKNRKLEIESFMHARRVLRSSEFAKDNFCCLRCMRMQEVVDFRA